MLGPWRHERATRARLARGEATARLNASARRADGTAPARSRSSPLAPRERQTPQRSAPSAREKEHQAARPPRDAAEPHRRVEPERAARHHHSAPRDDRPRAHRVANPIGGAVLRKAAPRSDLDRSPESRPARRPTPRWDHTWVRARWRRHRTTAPTQSRRTVATSPRGAADRRARAATRAAREPARTPASSGRAATTMARRYRVETRETCGVRWAVYLSASGAQPGSVAEGGLACVWSTHGARPNARGGVGIPAVYSSTTPGFPARAVDEPPII